MRLNTKHVCSAELNGIYSLINLHWIAVSAADLGCKASPFILGGTIMALAKGSGKVG